jgi:hypothetical protein
MSGAPQGVRIWDRTQSLQGFLIDEYYESPAGIANHWQDAMANWPDLSALMAWAGKGTVATLHNGTAVQALW